MTWAQLPFLWVRIFEVVSSLSSFWDGVCCHGNGGRDQERGIRALKCEVYSSCCMTPQWLPRQHTWSLFPFEWNQMDVNLDVHFLNIDHTDGSGIIVHVIAKKYNCKKTLHNIIKLYQNKFYFQMTSSDPIIFKPPVI